MQHTENATSNPLGAFESAQKTARVHGGNIREAIKRYGLEGRKVLDFSSNVNPLGPSAAARRAAKKALALIDRYPDPDMTDLRKAIARYFGIKPGQVICGNGSNGLIHLIPRVFRPKKVLVPMPTFTEYAASWWRTPPRPQGKPRSRCSSRTGRRACRRRWRCPPTARK